MRLKERLSIIWRDIKCYLASASKEGNQMLAIIPYKRRLIQIEERDPSLCSYLDFVASPGGLNFSLSTRLPFAVAQNWLHSFSFCFLAFCLRFCFSDKASCVRKV